MVDTLVVNLFGGPGAGKSTTAAGIFSLLKLNEINCELVTEVAKSLVWKESLYELNDQMFVTGSQYHSMFVLNGKVDIMITDSPLITGLMYNKVSDTFVKLTLELFRGFDNLNYYINRKKKYQNIGRSQTEDEALEIDGEFRLLVKEHDINYNNVDGNYEGINKIVEDILKIKGKTNKLKITQI